MLGPNGRTVETGYYKVLTRNPNGEFVSAVMGKNLGFVYTPGVWAERPGLEGKLDQRFGPMCVFRGIGQAKNFARDYHVIYHCDIVRARGITVWCKGRSLRPSLFTLPRGTVLADAVRIGEEVYRDES